MISACQRKPSIMAAWAVAALLVGGGAASAQTSAGPIVRDARSELKAGADFDAGSALLNMALVVSLAPPEGFAMPAGGGFAFAKADMAFSGHKVVVGGFHGFTIYDVSAPDSPQLVSAVVCPGGQGDVSLHGDLLFVSVEQNRARLDCGTQSDSAEVSAARFKGVRIFDIADPQTPKQIAAVQTCRGSHTHSLLPDPGDPTVLYIYNSGTGPVRPGEELAGCSGGDPDEDPDTARFSIDIIKVPLDAPENAAIIARPRIFADPATGAISGLWQGGDYGPGTQSSMATELCHDITLYPKIGLAAGACGGNGLLLDISDPEKPVRLDAIGDPNFSFWHSATFSNDGAKIVFTDEWGGGLAARCREGDPANWGGNALMTLENGKMRLHSFYKLPSIQSDVENCVAHNGSLIPVPGRDIMVQGWYSGGTSVMDFTDIDHPREIAYFDRGPVNAEQLTLAGSWSSYWYNGHIYVSGIARGLEILKLTPSAYLTENEIAAAEMVQQDVVNVQSQTEIVWPDHPVVARAYLDQLLRSEAIDAARAAAIGKALDRLDRGKKPRRRSALALADALDGEAASAEGGNAERLRAIARILRTRAR